MGTINLFEGRIRPNDGNDNAVDDNMNASKDMFVPKPT